MRICHVVENLNTGGLETVVIAMIREQLKKNHDCIVICLFEKGDLACKLAGTDAEVLECNKSNGFDWQAIKALRKSIMGFRPDCIHSHNNVAHIYACLSLLFLPYPLINTKHGLGAKSTRKQNILFRLTRHKTGMYVFVSRDAQHAYIQRGLVPESKSMVLHNGVDVESIPKRSHESRTAYLRQNAIKGEPVLICMVSRLNPLKDHYTLLQASASLKRDRSDWRLIIIGDGPMRSQIENNISALGLEDCVVLVGNKQDAYNLLQCFDIFVLSSHSEGHSIALLEAAAAGLPLVATDVGGNSEIVNDDIGYLVGHEDVNDLAKTLGVLVQDPLLRSRKGDNALQWVKENASISAMTAAYIEAYRHVSDGR